MMSRLSASGSGEIAEAFTLKLSPSNREGPETIFLSMIVPTRGRPDGMRRLLESLASHTSRLHQVEVIMVIDDDDDESRRIGHRDLTVEIVEVRPGLTMGQLNMAGYRHARGKFLMLLNDDVCVETKCWDNIVMSVLASQPDDIVLIHVNDTIFQDRLCTFPLVSRTFCDFSLGITDEGYRRYCIDDAIYNTFNLLGCLGHQRIIYLPDVVFRHANFEQDSIGIPVYTPIPEIRAEDARHLIETLPQRRDVAFRLAMHIEALARRGWDERRRDDICFLGDVEALRRPELSRRLVGAGAGADLDAPATLVVFSDDLTAPSAGACMRALKAHTRDPKIFVVDGVRADRAKVLNRLVAACTTDYLVVVDESVRVGEGWLTQLLSGVTHDVAVVAARVGKHRHGGEWPDALLLLDCAKCGDMRFDESFPLFFYDLDFRLRVQERGFRSVGVRCAGINTRASRGAETVHAGLLREEASRWTKKWIDTGRSQRLGPDLWREISRIVNLARFPAIVDELLGGETADEDGTAFTARLRTRLQPLAERGRLARAFWTSVEDELARRRVMPGKIAGGRRMLHLGSLSRSSPVSVLAYKISVGAQRRSEATRRYFATNVPAPAQREIGKLLCSLRMRKLGARVWNNALALENSRPSDRCPQGEQ